MNNEQKTVDQLSDLELARVIRDSLVESQRVNANLQVLNQELEARQKAHNAPQQEEAPKLDKATTLKK